MGAGALRRSAQGAALRSAWSRRRTTQRRDLAVLVSAVGGGVEGFPVGDEVLGFSWRRSTKASCKPMRHQVEELPPITVTVTEHRCQPVRCPGAVGAGGHSCPREVAASSFGPRLQAAVATMSVRNRISRVMSSSCATSCSDQGSAPGRSRRSSPARSECPSRPGQSRQSAHGTCTSAEL
jgi:hypothetical protein